MKEEWKDVPGYEGLYQVSSFGRVKSMPREWVAGYGAKRSHSGMVMKLSVNKLGYKGLQLCKAGKKSDWDAHQLVAMAFLNHTPCGYKIVVDHIDNNPSNNNLKNLQLVTNRENSNQKHIKSSSKFTGVYWHKNKSKWHAAIRIVGNPRYLGLFNCESTAGKMYELALEHIDLYDGDNKKFRELIKSKL